MGWLLGVSDSHVPGSDGCPSAVKPNLTHLTLLFHFIPRALQGTERRDWLVQVKGSSSESFM